MALSQSFNPRAIIRRSLIATAAAVTLMGGNAYAQEATAPVAPTPITDTVTGTPNTPEVSATRERGSNRDRNRERKRGRDRDRPETTTTVNEETCMETTQTSSRNGGLLGIIGVVRRTETTSTYNAVCGNNRISEAAAISLMTATTADGMPDIPMRALGVQIYLEQSPDRQARLDRILELQGTTFGRVNFSISGSTGPVQCVRMADAPAAAPGQVTTNVSFRCLPQRP